MSTSYKLIVNNQSANDATFAVYQKKPDIEGASNVFTLAWFTKYAYQGTTATFTWEVTYDFVWSRSGILKPGVIFTAGQTLPADPNSDDGGLNKITLDYDPQNDAFHFKDEVSDPAASGSLVAKTSNDVPQSSGNPTYAAAVGIGMSGYGTFVVQTQPNMTVKFEPHLTYYVVFGNFKQGQVVDIESIYGDALEVTYDNVFTHTATLDKDNKWTLV